MSESYNRLKRMQQKVWRRAANALLMLKQHLTISLTFLVIVVFGTFWIIFEQALEEHLFDNARNYGYGVARYASGDLRVMLKNENKQQSEAYLNRLVNTPLIVSASLFDKTGAMLAGATKQQGEQVDESQLITLLHDIQDQQQRIGILKITLNREEQEAPIQAFMNRLAFIAVALMIAAGLLAWYVGSFISKPIDRLFSMPLEAPDTEAVESMDVASELVDILHKSGQMSQSPAPLSEMESSGIHKLLAVDSQASHRAVIVMHINLYQMSNQYQRMAESDIVSLLRRIDQRLLVSIHGQTGMLVHYDGISASACFGLSDEISNPEYKALSCALLIRDLLKDIDVQVAIRIQSEERLILRHRHRMPLAVPFDANQIEPSDEIARKPFLVHQSLVDALVATDQLRLSACCDDWYQLDGMTDQAESLLLRQKDWTEYLLGDDI